MSDKVRVYTAADANWISLGIDGAGSDRFGDVIAAPASREIAGTAGFACGFVDFAELEMDFTVTYDEALYIIEGEVFFTVPGEEEVAGRPGEVVEIRYGTDVHVRVPDRCRIFYAAYPIDWFERHESELARLGR